VGREAIPAQIESPITGVDYAWTASGATLESATGSAITYSSSTVGTATLTVTASIANAVGGGAGASTTTTVNVLAPYSALEVVAGQVGGSGYRDGSVDVARFPIAKTWGNAARSVAVAADGTIYVAAGR